jgi:hypothetical protein
LSRDPWGVVYKLAAEKFKSRGILHSFQTDEGEITRDHKTTMTYLINNLLPDDDPTTNDEQQRINHGDYRAITGEPGSYLQVNEEEVKHLVSLIKNKKAPGPDNLKGKILKRLHPTITPLLVKILNACFKFSHKMEKRKARHTPEGPEGKPHKHQKLPSNYSSTGTRKNHRGDHKKSSRS